MSTCKPTVAGIIEDRWDWVVRNFNTTQQYILRALKDCRTPAMGGLVYTCNTCGEKHYRWKSCRNRHCPTCQNTQREAWVAARKEQLIQTTYYHVVFTIPHELNELCLHNQRQMYAMLFRTAWQTLDSFGWNHKYVGGQTGATMTLHTWGSNLSYHPHVHCIVPGGGVNLQNKWVEAKGGGKFLYPVKAMSRKFRGLFIDELKKSGLDFKQDLEKKLKKKNWVVYAKPPFGKVDTLIKYLAGYTFKSAITNRRITKYENGSVHFWYKDYKHGNVRKNTSMSAEEFLRRLALHFLPSGFTRIRHYGILSSSWKRKIFPNPTKKPKPDWKQIWANKGLLVDLCPSCKKGSLIPVGEIPPQRGPPSTNMTQKIRQVL